MALLFMEGFDGYTNNADMRQDSKITPNETSDLAQSISTGRIDGKSLYINDSNTYYVLASIPETSATFYMGFAFYAEQAYSTALSDVVRFYNTDDAAYQLYLSVNASGQLAVYRGAEVALLGTSTSAIIPDTWHYIVLKVFLNATTGTVELWFDGTKEINLTSQNTLGATTASVDRVYLFGENSFDRYFDDIYIGDDTGSDMTDQVGDCHIEMVQPDSNGTTNNFTPSTSAADNYTMVDEGQPDDDTTYVYSSTATDKELYGCAALTGNIDTVYAVQVKSLVRKEDAGYREIKSVCRSSATEVDGSALPVSTNYKTKDHIYENDPNGGGAWTESSVNAAEFGLKIFS